MDILAIIDDFEEKIQKSKRIPVTDKIVVSEEFILDFLDNIRSVLPEEIRKAKWLNKEKERVIQEAQEEAVRLLQEAQQEAKNLVSENDIVVQAQEVSEEIITQAKKVSREIKSGATDYADNILRQIEESLDKSLCIIKKSREELESIK